MTPWLAGLALVCSYVAWATIALTQSAHREWVGRMARGGCASRRGLIEAGDAPTRLGILFVRLGAVLLTLASAALCITQDGWSFGILMWSCLTCLAALLVTLTLTCLRARLQAQLQANLQARLQACPHAPPHAQPQSPPHSRD